MSGSWVFSPTGKGEFPSKVVHRGSGFLAIEDIAPTAPVHVLAAPERNVDSFREVEVLGADESKRTLEFGAERAKEAELDDYRLIVNVDGLSSSSADHLYWHVLGGRTLPFA